MGLTGGGDVQGAIGQLNAVDMATLMTDILDGVIIMHHNGMVHSDLKPENVLISPPCGGPMQCHAQIADFGLSCMMYQNLGMPPSGVDRGYCSQCALQGTPSYLSPEMLTGQQGTPAPPFDVWALGMIAYVLIFNGFPGSFQVGTRDELYRAIVNFRLDADPKFTARYQAFPQAPDGVFLRRALDPDPSTRYTAQQLQPLMAKWAQSWGATGAGAAVEPRPSEQCYLNEHCKGERVSKVDILDLFAHRGLELK